MIYMLRSSITALLIFASVAVSQTVSKTPLSAHKPQPKKDPIVVALNTLVSRSIYSCHLYPSTSFMARTNPEFVNGTDGDGKAILDGAVASYFHTGDRLVIRDAETDMETITERFDAARHPSTYLTLTVENQANKVKANVQVEVYKANITPSRMYFGITDNLWFSSKPIITDVRVGMTRSEVECTFSIPDHTNSDALGGDQMVYWGGKMYVYISPHTDRVTNVQTSY